MALSLFGGFDPLEAWSSSLVPSRMQEMSRMGSTDIKETDTELVFKTDCAGLKSSDVKVQVVDGNCLSISGERQEEKKEDKDTWHRVERNYGSFQRYFRLPDTVDTDKVSARVEHGVLQVTVPKHDKPKTSAVDVKVH
eukprot:m.9497 g.9497  ORF g.9497 m.9497 type:complete len:138 (-) comp5548_c0_seq1:36-449(-)